MLEDNNIHSVFIPGLAYTGEFQPIDISVNKVVKSFICAKFSEGHAEQVTAILQW